MKKLTVVAAIVLAVLFTFAACSATAPAASSAATPAASSAAPATTAPASAPPESSAAAPASVDASKVVIGFNQGSDTVDFLKKVGDSIKAEADKAGVKEVVTHSDFDGEKIIPNVNTLLMQGANVIIDFNVNAQIGGNIVQVCEAKGIHVIGIDVPYTSTDGKTSWFMGANNQKAGEVAGKALGDAAKTKFGGAVDAVVTFFNSENGPVVQKRTDGAIDGLKADGYNVTDDMVTKIDMGGGGADTTVAARDKFTNWLTANPDKHKIAICAVNDQSASGVFAAIQGAGRDKDCLLASHGCDNPAIQNLYGAANCWIGSVGYFPETYGKYLVPLAIKLATNQNAPQQTLMDHKFVDKSNVNQYYPQTAASASSSKS